MRRIDNEKTGYLLFFVAIKISEKLKIGVRL
jgi:hypothetical protein